MSNLKGVDSLMRKLSSLGGNAPEAMKKGIRKATILVQGDAKELAPVGTSQLRNSIKADVKEERGRVVGVVSTNLEYAPYIEFGTGQKGEASPSPPKYDGGLNYRQDWIGMPAQPFLFPAAEQRKKDVGKMVAEEIKTEIRKLGGK